MEVCTTNSGTDGQRMAGEPPGREKSGLYPGDRVEQANRLQVVEINGKLCYNNKKIFLGRKLL